MGQGPSRGPVPRPESRRLAEERLGRSGDSALRRLRCEVREGELRLIGSVPSHDLKQVALAVVSGIEGLRAIGDGIVVVLGTTGRGAVERAT
jgi:hypothetical protein